MVDGVKMEVNRREVPLYVSACMFLFQSVSVWCVCVCVCVWSIWIFILTLLDPILSFFFSPELEHSSHSPLAISFLSLSQSLCAFGLTGKPCVAGETQARRVSVPGEAGPYRACLPNDKSLPKAQLEPEWGWCMNLMNTHFLEAC